MPVIGERCLRSRPGEKTMLTSPILLASVVDLDATFFIQLGLFLVLALLLRGILWKPFMELIERRDHEINGLKKEAEAAEEEARKREAHYLDEYRAVQNRATERRTELLGQAARENAKVIDDARAQAQGTVSTARAKLDAQMTEARGRAQAESQDVARMVCERILGRKVTS